MLLLDSRNKWLHLVINIIFFQQYNIVRHLFDWCHKTPGKPVCKDCAQYKYAESHRQREIYHLDDQTVDAVTVFSNTQNFSVICSHCIIKSMFCGRSRFPHRTPLSGCQCRSDLRSFPVIFHLRLVFHAVIDDGSILIDQRDTQPIFIQIIVDLIRQILRVHHGDHMGVCLQIVKNLFFQYIIKKHHGTDCHDNNCNR